MTEGRSWCVEKSRMRGFERWLCRLLITANIFFFLFLLAKVLEQLVIGRQICGS